MCIVCDRFILYFPTLRGHIACIICSLFAQQKMRHFLKTPHCIHRQILSRRGLGDIARGARAIPCRKPPYNSFLLITSGSINARSAGGTSNSVLHLKNTQTDSPIAIFKQVISTDYIDNISCMFIISQTVRCDHRQMNCLVCFSLCLENTDFV